MCRLVWCSHRTYWFHADLEAGRITKMLGWLILPEPHQINKLVPNIQKPKLSIVQKEAP